MKSIRSISRWVYPFFLGVVIFNFLRLATDPLKDNTFWAGSIPQHIVSQILLIGACYVFDIKWRNYLKKKTRKHEKDASLIKEYSFVLAATAISLNLFALTGELAGIFYMGNGFIDYIILNVIALPLLLLYYIAIRSDIISKDYNEQFLQLEQIKSKQLETELDYLKAQYHPHFLFNALNTIYFQISEDNVSAKKTVELLSELLRYQLYDVSKIVSISQEMDFIKTYIQFQQLRMSDRLQLKLYIDPSLKEEKVHPLLFQPLLENAFKYVGGEYYIHIDIRNKEGKIHFKVENSTADIEQPVNKLKKDKGIGIENLKRRLSLLYPGKHELQTEQRKQSFISHLMIDPYGTEN